MVTHYKERLEILTKLYKNNSELVHQVGKDSWFLD